MLPTAEGWIGDDTTTKLIQAYDTQRQRAVASWGWQPFAYPPGYSSDQTVNTTVTLAANGGSIAIPILITGHMLLQDLMLRNADTATARSAEWRLYQQYLNNGNSGENTLTFVTGTDGTFSFTPVAASIRTSAPSGVPVYLPPGFYWLVLRNTHATSTFALSCGPLGTFQNNQMQTKTLSSALGTTLDFVAATWAKNTNTPAVILQGRVFGQTTAF